MDENTKTAMETIRKSMENLEKEVSLFSDFLDNMRTWMNDVGDSL